MQKKLTITVDAEVYEGLYKVVRRRNISRFLTDLARPHVVPDALEASYRAQALDEADGQEALEWIESVVGDVADDPA